MNWQESYKKIEEIVLSLQKEKEAGKVFVLEPGVFVNSTELTEICNIFAHCEHDVHVNTITDFCGCVSRFFALYDTKFFVDADVMEWDGKVANVDIFINAPAQILVDCTSCYVSCCGHIIHVIAEAFNLERISCQYNEETDCDHFVLVAKKNA